MAHRSEIYWYLESPFVAKAFLYNCRDDDLERSDVTKIAAGTIVLGQNGVHVAENAVFGFAARRTSEFHPTRRCEWQGHELECMVHSDVGASPYTTSELRHRGCVVARLSRQNERATATSLKVPVVTHRQGITLINLSVERHPGQEAAKGVMG